MYENSTCNWELFTFFKRCLLMKTMLHPRFFWCRSDHAIFPFYLIRYIKDSNNFTQFLSEFFYLPYVPLSSGLRVDHVSSGSGHLVAKRQDADRVARCTATRVNARWGRGGGRQRLGAAASCRRSSSAPSLPAGACRSLAAPQRRWPTIGWRLWSPRSPPRGAGTLQSPASGRG